jgi:hypothetical protein
MLPSDGSSTDMLPTWLSTPRAGSKTRMPEKIRGPAIVMTAAQTTSAIAITSPRNRAAPDPSRLGRATAMRSPGMLRTASSTTAR